MVRSRYIFRLDEIDEKTPSVLVGGFVLEIAGLANAGFPVPAGFVVTSYAYEEFLNRAGLAKAKAEWSERIKNCEEVGRTNIISEIESQVSAISLPAVIEADLRAAFEEIGVGDDGVFLMGSFNGEDKRDESYKLIRGKDVDSFIKGVVECWEDIFIHDVENSRGVNAIGDKHIKPALLCLKCPTTVSHGMAYSCDPHSGDRQKLVIHAWRGEEPVSEEPSEVFIVDRNNLTVSERKCSEGGPSGMAEGFAKELARLVLRVESHFRLPRKIKWLFSGERFYILGIDKLLIEAEKISTVWGGFGPIELPSYRLTPLSADLLALCLEKAGEQWGAEKSPFKPNNKKLVKLINGHFYWNMSAMAAILAGIPLVDPWLVPAFRGTPVELELFSRNAKKSFNFMQNALVFFKFAKWVKRCIKNYENIRENFLKKDDEFIRADLKGKPDASLYLLFEELVDDFSLFLKAKIEIGLITQMFFYLLMSILINFVPDGDKEDDKFSKCLSLLFSLLPENRSGAFEMLDEMRKLAQLAVACEICEFLKARTTYSDFNGMLRRDEGGDVFLKRLEAFLDAYGHRCVGEEELSIPRWRENAEEVYLWLEKLIDENEKSSKELVSPTTDAGVDEKPHLELPYLERLVFGWAVRNCGRMTNLLSEANGLSAKGFMCFRFFALEAGRRFFSRGFIESADDIFYLSYDEIQKLLKMSLIPMHELRKLVKDRREEYQTKKGKIVPAFIVGESYQEESEEEVALFEPEAESFEGIGVSSGTNAGRVRVLLDLKDVITLKQGEIAVISASGRWLLPALLFAGAFAAEDSTFLNETVLTARRMKIPFINSVRNITKSIMLDKCWIVNADEGMMRIFRGEENLELEGSGDDR